MEKPKKKKKTTPSITRPALSPDFFKPKKYTPEELGQKFVEYYNDTQSRVWNKKEAIKSGENAGQIIDIPTSLPLAIGHFCVYAGITHQTFLNYEKEKGYEAYFEVTAHIRTVIESDQKVGALIGMYNHNIVSALVGLAQKREVTQTNDNFNHKVKRANVKFRSKKKK